VAVYPFLPSKLDDQLKEIYKALDNHRLVLEALAEGFLVESLDPFKWGDLRSELVNYARDLTDTVGRLEEGVGGEVAPQETDLFSVSLRDRIVFGYKQAEQLLRTLAGERFPGEVEATQNARKAAYSSLSHHIPNTLDAIGKANPEFKKALGDALSLYVTGVPPAMTEYLDLAQHRIDDLRAQLYERGLVDPDVLVGPGIEGDIALEVEIKPPSTWLWDKVRTLIDTFFLSQVHWWFGLLVRVFEHIWDDPDPLSEVETPDLFEEMASDKNWQELAEFYPIADMTVEEIRRYDNQ